MAVATGFMGCLDDSQIAR